MINNLMIFFKWSLRIFLLSLLAFSSSCQFKNNPTAYLNLKSAKYLNPNIHGTASPVVVTIYQLKASEKFNQSDFTDLSKNIIKFLGSDLIDKQSIEIRPNSQHEIKLTLSSNTNYLGITAGYRNINYAKWRKIINILPEDSKINININLESQGISLIIKRPNILKLSF